MSVGSWLGCILAAYLLGIVSAMCGIRKLQAEANSRTSEGLDEA